MPPSKKGYGPTLSEITKFTGTAKDLLDKQRVKSFLALTKKELSQNRYGTKRNKNQKRFVHHDAKFACDLKTHKCCAKTKSGRLCSRNVVRGLFLCWQHTKAIYKVMKAKSNIPNTNMYGLFACEDIPKDTVILPYFGEYLTSKQLNDRYPGDNTAPYGLSFKGVPGKSAIDAACLQGMGGLANRGMVSAKLYNNAHFINSKPYPKIASTKKISAGQEIFVAYGSSYKFTNSTIVPKEKPRPIRC